jgi:hypothetical protein
MKVENCVYVAYQGDVGEYQSAHVREGVTQDEMIESEVVQAMRACLLGWWSAAENKGLAVSLSENAKFVGLTSGFVVRATDSQWILYEVTFTSDDLLEATVVEADRGKDRRKMPTSWPVWLHGERSKCEMPQLIEGHTDLALHQQLYLAADSVRDFSRFATEEHPLLAKQVERLMKVVAAIQSEPSSP